MIERHIQDHPHATSVQLPHQFFQGLGRAKMRVHPAKIRRIVFMYGFSFPQRIEIYDGYAKLFQIVQLLPDAFDIATVETPPVRLPFRQILALLQTNDIIPIVHKVVILLIGRQIPARRWRDNRVFIIVFVKILIEFGITIIKAIHKDLIDNAFRYPVRDLKQGIVLWIERKRQAVIA